MDSSRVGLHTHDRGLLSPKVEDKLIALTAGSALFLTVTAALAYVVVYCVIAYFRIPYPFNLEWLEGAMLQHAERILEGKPIYVAPSMDFSPFIYTPLYHYLAAIMCKISGLNLGSLRLISFVASLGSFVVAYHIVRRETRNAIAGIVAVGLFAATFKIGGAWFDLAHVDTLMVFFLLCGVYADRFWRGYAGVFATVLMLTLAYFTKQSSLVIILAIVMGEFFINWRRAFVLGGLLTVLLGGSTWALDWYYDGWYVHWLFRQVSVPGISKRIWIGFWTQDLAASYGIACAMACIGLLLLMGRARLHGFIFYSAVTLSAVVMSWASRLHVGGYLNVNMPALLMIAVMSGIGVGEILDRVRQRTPRQRQAVTVGLCCVLLVQFALLIYNPAKQIPTKADREAGQRILDLIEQTEGDVFIPYDNYLPAYVGKKTFVTLASIKALFADRGTAHVDAFEQEFKEKFRNREFALVVMGSQRHFNREISRYYRPLHFSVGPPNVYRTVTGMHTRPKYFYVPKPKPPQPLDTQKKNVS